MMRGGSWKDIPLNPPNSCFSKSSSPYAPGGEEGGAGVESPCSGYSFKSEGTLGWLAGRSASAQLPARSVFPFSPGSTPGDSSALL